jgi:hypothetical protein
MRVARIHNETCRSEHGLPEHEIEIAVCGTMSAARHDIYCVSSGVQSIMNVGRCIPTRLAEVKRHLFCLIGWFPRAPTAFEGDAFEWPCIELKSDVVPTLIPVRSNTS